MSQAPGIHKGLLQASARALVGAGLETWVVMGTWIWSATSFPACIQLQQLHGEEEEPDPKVLTPSFPLAYWPSSGVRVRAAMASPRTGSPAPAVHGAGSCVSPAWSALLLRKHSLPQCEQSGWLCGGHTGLSAPPSWKILLGPAKPGLACGSRPPPGERAGTRSGEALPAQA